MICGGSPLLLISTSLLTFNMSRHVNKSRFSHRIVFRNISSSILFSPDAHSSDADDERVKHESEKTRHGFKRRIIIGSFHDNLNWHFIHLVHVLHFSSLFFSIFFSSTTLSFLYSLTSDTHFIHVSLVYMRRIIMVKPDDHDACSVLVILFLHISNGSWSHQWWSCWWCQ